ncbi:MAG: metalloregulator ArsR/SmtB family transcription factor [Rhodospirillales bacterium]|nr:metalloregulator ArsR/SmtB family transcription factor [Rhodospirillales bacterium]
MEKTEIITALSGLAHDTRLDIFRLLVEAGPQGLAVGEIGEAVGVPPATLNHHLAQLKLAGLVRVERDGRKLIHRADYERMNGLLSYLTSNCCKGSPCGG